LVSEQGIAGVDQTYRLLPASTEQILHPEKYFTMEPGLEVTVTETPLAGYEVFQEGVFGEWNLQLFLQDAVDPGSAVIASAGWGGDLYRVLTAGGEVVFIYRFEGDTPRDAEELEATLLVAAEEGMGLGEGVEEDEGGTAFAGADFAFVQRFERAVLFVAASDPTAGPPIVDLLRLPPQPDSPDA
jgi:hypothetical protein